MRRETAVRAGSLLPLLFGVFVTYPLLRFMLLPLVPGLGPAMAPSAGLGPGLGVALGYSPRHAGSLLHGAAGRLVGDHAGAPQLAGRPTTDGNAAADLPFPGLSRRSGMANPAGDLRDRSHADAARRAARLVRLGRVNREATRVHVRSRWRRWRLGLHPIALAAATAFLVVFVETMHEYGLATTLGARLRLPLLVAEIYASLSTWPISWSRAALAGDLLMLATFVSLAARLWFRRLAALPLDRGLSLPPRPATRLEGAATYAMTAAIFTAGAAVPLVALFADAVLPSTELLPEGAWAAIITSPLYAFVGALGATGLAAALAATRSGGVTRWMA